MAAVLQLILTIASMAVATPLASPRTPPLQPEIETEAGLRSALEPLEARYEAACGHLGEALLGAASKPAMDHRSALESARSELAAVYADPVLERVLAEWARRTTATVDPTLTRRVELWRRSRIIASIELDRDIFTLQQDLAARQRRKRHPWEGRSVTTAALERIVATDPDRRKRQSAWLAMAAHAGEMRDDVKRLIRMRAVKAQGTDSRYFHHLIYGAQDVDAYWAYHVMEHLESKSRPAYQALVEHLKASVGVKQLEPWDLQYALNARTRERGLDGDLAEAFPAGGALAAARRLVEAVGFSPDPRGIRAEMADLGTGESLVLAIRIPGDTRILLDRQADGGGPRAYAAALEAYGRALQSAYNGQTSPALKGYDCVSGTRNEVYAEGMARALGDLLLEPTVLERHFGMRRDRIDRYLEDEADRELMAVRELLLDMAFEFVACVNPDASLDERYRELHLRSLGAAIPAGSPAPWPARTAYVTRPGVYLDRLIALSMAPVVRARLREAAGGEGLPGRGVATWLIERCYDGGELLDLQERQHRSIHGGMDFDAYLATLSTPRPVRPAR